MELLFTLAHWHGLAKLRMHTDMTLNVLDLNTTILGQKLRGFRDETCSVFVTKELERERAARQRRRERTAAQSIPSGVSTNSARKPKSFNLKTPKLHSLGDYKMMIYLLGTTDSYTTQLVSATHRGRRR